MQAITVHKAQQADANLLAEMAQELAAFEGELSRVSAEALHRAFAENHAPQLQGLIAKAGQHAVGFLLYYAGYDVASASGGFHLADMYVRQAQRKRGVARALVRNLAHQAKEEGRQWLSLTVLHENAGAQHFYHQLGFTAVPVQFYAIGSAGLEGLL